MCIKLPWQLAHRQPEDPDENFRKRPLLACEKRREETRAALHLSNLSFTFQEGSRGFPKKLWRNGNGSPRENRDFWKRIPTTQGSEWFNRGFKKLCWALQHTRALSDLSTLCRQRQTQEWRVSCHQVFWLAFYMKYSLSWRTPYLALSRVEDRVAEQSLEESKHARTKWIIRTGLRAEALYHTTINSDTSGWG